MPNQAFKFSLEPLSQVTNQKFPKGTLLFFLIASQFQDLLWFILQYSVLEPTGPIDVFDTTLSTLNADMLYSHDLLSQIYWLVIIFIIRKLVFKSTKIGLVGSLLAAIHFMLDIFSGNPHHILGQTPQT